MNDIKCPHCDTAFKIDESGYANILKQVRDREFEQEVNKAVQPAVELANKKLEIEFLKSIAELNSEIVSLKSENDLLRDYKIKFSTKMIGESLEQHCEAEFNRMRSTAFKNAYFEKDNDAKTGSKGDYIFKEADSDGNEIVSIMFEMKNESDTTTTKKKNENFFKELDKDRNEKNCEYAILVSLLETDNEFYNSGIVDVSHRYDKMYVIRPQCFIPMITLLRDAALNSLEYKKELALVKAQMIDVTNFEADLEDWKSKFGKNFDLASSHFEKAMIEIDKSILHLEKTRDWLFKSLSQLRHSNNKAKALTVKKLTRGNATMESMFDSIEKKPN